MRQRVGSQRALGMAGPRYHYPSRIRKKRFPSYKIRSGTSGPDLWGIARGTNRDDTILQAKRRGISSVRLKQHGCVVSPRRARAARVRDELQGAGDCPGPCAVAGCGSTRGCLRRLLRRSLAPAARGAAFARRMPLATCQSDSPIHFVCAPTCQDWIDFTRDHTEIPVFAGGYAGRNVTGACNPLACVSSVER